MFLLTESKVVSRQESGSQIQIGLPKTTTQMVNEAKRRVEEAATLGRSLLKYLEADRRAVLKQSTQ